MNKFLKVLSYVLVAAVACTATLLISGNWQQINPESKLTQLADLIDKYYADDVDMGALEDAAANAMVEALPDRWSYYISADEYASYLENKNNAYVGIGVTIQAEEEGYLITKLSSGGPAEEAGLQPGDRMVMADGHSLVGVPVEECRGYIQGKEGTTVAITVLREGEQLTFTVERRTVRTPVATGTMLDNQIGLVKIANFNSHCADETIAAVEALLEQGAKALIFDVRFNGGGYTKEMVTLLDYLLPAVPVFRTVDYKGKVFWIQPTGVTSYKVERSVNGGSTWTQISGSVSIDTETGSYRYCMTDPSPVSSGSVQYRITVNGKTSYTNVWKY